MEMAANPLIFPLVILISLISGPLNEEFGWRGYALDRLMAKFGFLKGSLIPGFVWAIWHLLWYFTPGQAQYALMILGSVCLLGDLVRCHRGNRTCISAVWACACNIGSEFPV